MDLAQRCLPGGTTWVLFSAAAFWRFSARFSLRDLPAFLDMCCRGDLSAMTAPWRSLTGFSCPAYAELTRPAGGWALRVSSVSGGVFMGRVVHFEIQADDVERAKAFYSAVFGWS